MFFYKLYQRFKGQSTSIGAATLCVYNYTILINFPTE